ncbi:hypothetical protein GQR58_021656 [Nymphon striatum]|nr:hypothetical protein GQR58_021656 [Nymphon striatum]
MKDAGQRTHWVTCEGVWTNHVIIIFDIENGCHIKFRAYRPPRGYTNLNAAIFEDLTRNMSNFKNLSKCAQLNFFFLTYSLTANINTKTSFASLYHEMVSINLINCHWIMKIKTIDDPFKRNLFYAPKTIATRWAKNGESATEVYLFTVLVQLIKPLPISTILLKYPIGNVQNLIVSRTEAQCSFGTIAAFSARFLAATSFSWHHSLHERRYSATPCESVKDWMEDSYNDTSKAESTSLYTSVCIGVKLTLHIFTPIGNNIQNIELDVADILLKIHDRITAGACKEVNPTIALRKHQISDEISFNHQHELPSLDHLNTPAPRVMKKAKENYRSASVLPIGNTVKILSNSWIFGNNMLSECLAKSHVTEGRNGWSHWYHHFICTEEVENMVKVCHEPTQRHNQLQSMRNQLSFDQNQLQNIRNQQHQLKFDWNQLQNIRTQQHQLKFDWNRLKDITNYKASTLI